MDDLLPPSLRALLEAVTDSDCGVPCLPIEMIDDGADAAWMAILGSRNRIKELADKFRKLKIETGLPRKHLKVLPDAVLLGYCYATPFMTDQLDRQLSPQQIESLGGISLSNRFLPELLGHYMPDLAEIPTWSSHARIKERILVLLPEAESTLSLAWGTTTYRQMLVLGYLLKIGPDLEPGTPRYYQACFALMAVLYDLIDTPIIQETFKSGLEIPGFEQVFRGMMAVKLSYAVSGVKGPGAVLQTSQSMSMALSELAHEFTWDPTAGIRVFELLHTLFQPDHQGLKRVVEEYVWTAINSYLVWMTAHLQKAVAEAEIETCFSDLPEPMDEWFLQPARGMVTTEHFKLLQPLISPLMVHEMRTGEARMTPITEKASLIKKHRQAVRSATSGGTIDPVKITTAAEALNRSSTEMTELVKDAVTTIQTVLAACEKVQLEWNLLAVDEAAPAPEPAHLSESASSEDREILALAMDESQLLRSQLQEAQTQIHALNLKVDAASFHQEQSYQGPAISPELLRKVVSSPDSLTPTEVLAYIQYVGDGKVSVLPSAWRSADESESFEYPGRMLDLLDRLVFQYAPALASGKPDAEARELLGASYSSRESNTVVLNPSMRSERTFLVDGVPRYFGRHLSIGNDPSAARGMRIYFDLIDGVIAIAYCGKHLTVSSTN